MTPLTVESVRGHLVETVHRVSAAIVDVDGRLVARAGDPDLLSPMRSVAKPFQAVPVVADGAFERFGMTTEELAMTCASHSAELRHIEIVRSLLRRVGCEEGDLVCGPHASLAAELAVGELVPPDRSADERPSSLASNCSGKHAGMLALARHHGWDVRGYNRATHPVQQRCRHEVARWTDIPADRLGEAVDGCGVVCFGGPLRNIGLGFARIARSDDLSARQVVAAMWAHSGLVAGRGRLCTALMTSYAGRVLAKVGAAGLYGLALPEPGFGIALKVEDGNARAAMVATVRILAELGLEPSPADQCRRFGEIAVLNTRGEPVGIVRAVGSLAFE